MALENEEWRLVVGYEGWYDVSNLGRVRNAKGKILRFRNCLGYNRPALNRDGQTSHIGAHRLVMAAFVGPEPPGHEVNHINNRRDDNRLENLEYVTRRQNMRHKVLFGTDPSLERNPRAKLDRKKVRTIRTRRASGEKLAALAREYGVHKNTIWWAVTGGTWQGIGGPA